MRKFVFTLIVHVLLALSSTAQIDSFPPNLLVNTTVRIEGYRDTIIKGVRKWNTSTGTGFFFMFHIDTTEFECIVTNRHVIENSTFGRLRFKILDKADHIFAKASKTLEIPNFNRQWIMHPNEDLAILPLAPIAEKFRSEFGAEIRHVFFVDALFPTSKDSLEISCIEKVLMIGYPKGLWDSINNLPIIRQGLTATPYFGNFNGQRRFLIDIPTFPGSSGSPILLYSYDPYWTSKFWMKNDFRTYLLGVVAQSYNYDALGSIVISKQEPTAGDSLGIAKKYTTATEIPFNLAIVIKAERLNDFIPVIKKYLYSNKKTVR